MVICKIELEPKENKIWNKDEIEPQRIRPNSVIMALALVPHIIFYSFGELSWFLYNAEPFKNQVVFMGSYFEGEAMSLKNI